MNSVDNSAENQRFFGLVVVAVAAVVTTITRRRAERYTPLGVIHPSRLRFRETGVDQLDSILQDSEYLYWYTRCRPAAFELLLERLQCSIRYPLKDGRRYQRYHRLAVFLNIVGSDVSYRSIALQIKCSIRTVGEIFYAVLRSLATLYHDEVRPITEVVDLPSRYQASTKFWPFFKGCIGALDGSHLPVHVVGEQAAWRNRKQSLSQNVLAVVDFEMRFTYVLAGWEGSAHDAKVLSSARSRGFRPPAGSYYLADAGYSNKDDILVPYRGVRYHLREQKAAGRRPETPQEVFNLRHAQMRNVVERAFGVFKGRFQILKKGQPFPMRIQIKLVYALAALHNFLLTHQGLQKDDEAAVKAAVEAALVAKEEPLNCEDLEPEVLQSVTMTQKRELIAEAMWRNYRAYRGRD